MNQSEPWTSGPVSLQLDLPKWEMTIGAITVGIYTPPNLFHRWMQRLFLGITYTRIKP